MNSIKIISVCNQKGGVGKTTSVLNIGDALSRLGKKILLIDLDPQGHLTHSLGINTNDLDSSIYNLLKKEIGYRDILIDRGGIKLIPSSINLSGADIELSAVPGREFLLKESLKDLNEFDYVLIDCPPSLGILTINALVYAQEIFIPLQTEYLALQGLSELSKTIDIVKSRLNGELEISGIIGVRYDKRKILNNEVLDEIKEHFGDKLFRTLIRENISLAEAPSYGQTIFEYKKESHGAEDYFNLSQEIIERNLNNE